jgi:serine protease Do
VRGAVTIGVIHRALPHSHPGRARELIHADVLLGPGSSGGPLADARGRVVGINAMVGGGMALAVPSHVVARLLGRLGKFGQNAERPLLGVSAQEVPLPDALAALIPVPAVDVTSTPRETRSAMVLTGVEPGSAADGAGLLLGDLVYAVDGYAVEGGAGLLNALDGHLEGPLVLSVLRGGVPLDLTVTFGAGEPVPGESVPAAERELAYAA